MNKFEICNLWIWHQWLSLHNWIILSYIFGFSLLYSHSTRRLCSCVATFVYIYAQGKFKKKKTWLFYHQIFNNNIGIVRGFYWKIFPVKQGLVSICEQSNCSRRTHCCCRNLCQKKRSQTVHISIQYFDGRIMSTVTKRNWSDFSIIRINSKKLSVAIGNDFMCP